MRPELANKKRIGEWNYHLPRCEPYIPIWSSTDITDTYVVTLVHARFAPSNFMIAPKLSMAPYLLTLKVVYPSITIHLSNIYNPVYIGRKASAKPTSTEIFLQTCQIPQNTFLIGDFNRHSSLWTDMGTNVNRASQLTEWLSNQNFIPCQPFNAITRKQSVHNTAPDAILVNNYGLAASARQSFSNTFLTLSDHSVLKIHPLPRQLPETFLSNFVPDSSVAAWLEAMKEDSRLLKPTFAEPKDIDDWIGFFFNRSQSVVHSLRPRAFFETRQAKWWNENVQTVVDEYLNHPDTNSHAFAVKAISDAKRSFFNDRNTKCDLTNFWSTTRRARDRLPLHILSIKRPNQEPATSNDEIVEEFQREFFPPTNTPPCDLIPTTDATHQPITRDEVLEAMATVPLHSTPGPSGITYPALRAFCAYDTTTIIDLFNAMIMLQHFPAALKAAFITMVPKPKRSEPDEARSYRPIAVEETLAKLFERVITQRITTVLENSQWFPREQHGGRRAASCLTAFHDLTQYVKQPGVGTTTVLLTDVKGFYDNIPHIQIRDSLISAKVNPKLINIICSFLSDRECTLSINHTIGRPFIKPNNGVPQGSPLSPVLATIAAAPVIKLFKQLRPHSFIRAYMDDHLIAQKAIDIDENYVKLQEDLLCLTALFNSIHLMIDPSSLELMNIGRSPKPVSTAFLCLGYPPTTPSTSMTWLGIRCSRAFTFNEHVKGRVLKAKQAFSSYKFLSSTYNGMKPRFLCLLYFNIVRSILTWGSSIWYPLQPKLAIKLQAVQNMCLRHIGGFLATSPIDLMESALSIPPIDLFIREQCQRFALQIHSRRSYVPAETLYLTNTFTVLIPEFQPQSLEQTFVSMPSVPIRAQFHFPTKRQFKAHRLLLFAFLRQHLPTTIYASAQATVAFSHTANLAPHSDFCTSLAHDLGGRVDHKFAILQSITNALTQLIEHVTTGYNKHVCIVTTSHAALSDIQLPHHSNHPELVLRVRSLIAKLNEGQTSVHLWLTRKSEAPELFKVPPGHPIQSPKSPTPEYLRKSFRRELVNFWRLRIRASPFLTNLPPPNQKELQDPSRQPRFPLTSGTTRNLQTLYLRTVINKPLLRAVTSKWSTASPNCTTCNEPEDANHRLNRCPRFAHIRRQLKGRPTFPHHASFWFSSDMFTNPLTAQFFVPDDNPFPPSIPPRFRSPCS